MSDRKEIHGYTYGSKAVAQSPVTDRELLELKLGAGFTDEDARWLRLAGEVLADQTEQIVKHWRSGIIAGIPHLARHSRSPENEALPGYLANTNLRFEQWIMDTCQRPYDRDWLNYQHEIALRHTPVKKNQTDLVASTDHVPLRDATSFVAVINETMKAYLGNKGHSTDEVDHMHLAWCKSMQIQMALWIETYASVRSK